MPSHEPDSASNPDRFDELLHRSLLEDEDDFLLDPDLLTAGDDDGAQEGDLADLGLMREALGNYKAETLRLAEQQSAAMPAPHVGKVTALWHSTPRWAVAAAAAAALAFTTTVATHRATEPAPVAMAAPTAQAITDDNRLLLSVDVALNAAAAPTEQELGLTAIPAQTTKQGRATN